MDHTTEREEDRTDTIIQGGGRKEANRVTVKATVKVEGEGAMGEGKVDLIRQGIRKAGHTMATTR